MTAYQTLSDRFRRIGLLNDAGAILSWDGAAMMPAGSAAARAEVDAALAITIHERLTAPDMGEWFDRVDVAPLDAWQRANLAAMRRQWLHATAVPADLVEAQAKAASACEHRWRTARKENDFKGLQPLLEEVLRLTRAVARVKAEAFGCSPYDALLDQYEPGGSSARIKGLFDELKTFLPGLIAGALEAQSRRPAPLQPQGPFPIEAQRALGQTMMQASALISAAGGLISPPTRSAAARPMISA